MKSYIVKKQFAGLKEGTELRQEGKCINYKSDDNKFYPLNLNYALAEILTQHALALGFIEETGKIAQEVGGENEITYLMPDGSPLFSHRNKPAGNKCCKECLGFAYTESNNWYCRDSSCPCHKVGGEKKEERRRCDKCRGFFAPHHIIHSDQGDGKSYHTACQPPQNEWRPKEQEIYWYCDSTGRVFGTNNDTTESDNLRIALGNYFRTESAALRAAEEIRNLLKKLPKE